MESELAKLSETAGVDLIAIRNKYKNGNYNPQQDTSMDYSSTDTQNQDQEIEKLKHEIDMISSIKKLDQYKICQTCHGIGTVVEVYNHFRMEKNCPECDGDAVSYSVPNIPGVTA